MKVIKSVLFVTILCFLLLTLQYIFQPKWVYPLDKEEHGGKANEFSELKKDSLDVVFTGTSHVIYGINPMQLYKERRIVSYNMAISAHRISPLYYQLVGMFKTQHPQVVMVDLSVLYLNHYLDAPWRRVLDTYLPLDRDKLEAANQYAVESIKAAEDAKKKEEETAALKWSVSGEDPEEEEKKTEDNEILRAVQDAKALFQAELGAVFPLYKYHSRWEELVYSDFNPKSENPYYGKGFIISTLVGKVWGTRESVNQIVEDMKSRRAAPEYRIKNGKKTLKINNNALYRDTPDEEQMICLRKIQELCEKNGAKLILVKVPVISSTRDYDSSWTKDRSECVRRIAKNMGVGFCDLVYGYDAGIDTASDFSDNGMHLNYYGAKKVTSFLGLYLDTVCGVQGGSDAYYNSTLPIYEKVNKAAMLQKATTWKKYMNRLKENKAGRTILLAVKGLKGVHFTAKELKRLTALGMKTEDLEAFGEESYIGIINNGRSVYEARGTLPVETTVQLDEETEISMLSIGAAAFNDRNPIASIKINKTEYSLNGWGINIVVFDNATKAVIDRVYFSKTDTDGNISGAKNIVLENTDIKEYEHRLFVKHQENYGKAG